MHCDTWQDKIDAFVDAELTPEMEEALQEHLRSCPACTAEAMARQRLKVETRLAAREHFTPDLAFEQQIRRRIAARPKLGFWALRLAGALAVLVIVIAVGFTWNRQQGKQALLAEFIDQHVQTVTSASAVDVASSDPHVVKPWFQGKVPFSVELPDLTGSDYTLVGGRVAYVHQNPAAQLVFTAHKHRISVFMFREQNVTAILGDSSKPFKALGYHSETWVEDGTRYFAVSDANPQDIAHLCDMLRQADES